MLLLDKTLAEALLKLVAVAGMGDEVTALMIGLFLMDVVLDVARMETVEYRIWVDSRVECKCKRSEQLAEQVLELAS